MKAPELARFPKPREVRIREDMLSQDNPPGPKTARGGARPLSREVKTLVSSGRAARQLGRRVQFALSNSRTS